MASECRSKARLDGKTSVITGCNTGIGKATAEDFVRRGCRVVMACRDVGKAEDAAEDIRKATAGVEGVGVIVVVRLDLSSFASVRECAAQLLQNEQQINLLINNAGVAFCPWQLTEDGFETHFAVNHLGHFLFTLLLLPRIRSSTPARIVNLSSLIYITGKIHFDDINGKKSYSPINAYAQSKLANVLFTKELAIKLKDSGVQTYSVHPGVVDTDAGRHYDTAFFRGSNWILKNIVSIAMKTPVQGAQTTIYCAVDEKAANETGFHYSDCAKATQWSMGQDPALALRLWEESVKWVGLEDYDPFAPEAKAATGGLVERRRLQTPQTRFR